MQVLFVLLTVLLAGQTAPASREVLVLDLTGPVPPRTLAGKGPWRMRSFARVSPARDGDGRGGPQPWPLRATLLGITPGREPNTWTVELRLEATSEVRLPRSVDHDRVDPDPAAPLPSIRQMSFALERAESQSPMRLALVAEGSQGVYGSDLVPGSLITLRTGESIRVRFAARRAWPNAVRPGNPTVMPGEPLPVRVHVMTHAGEYGHPSLRSENVLEVTPR